MKLLMIYVHSAVFLYVGAGLVVAGWRAYDSRETDPLVFRIACFPIDVALWPLVAKYWKRSP